MLNHLPKHRKRISSKNFRYPHTEFRFAVVRPVLLMIPLLLGLGCLGEIETFKGVEIDFWTVGSEAESMSGILAGFQRENPEVRVRLQQMPWSAAHEKILTAFAGNSTPDLCQLGNTWIPEFAALGALLELSELQQTAELSKGDYFPGIWATNEINGQLFGIPWYVDTRVLFYRHDLLRAAGFEVVPQTWQSWREAMQAIKQILPEGAHPILLPTNEWEQIVILGLNSDKPMLREGGQFANFRNAGFLQASEFYLSLYREQLAPIVSTTEIANMWDEFNRGRFAMFITGPWNIGEFRKQLDPEQYAKWSTAPLPAPHDSGIGNSMAGGCSLAIFKRCRHPQATWKLVQYLSRPEIQIEFYRATGNLPARQTAWEDSAFTNDPWTGAFRQQLRYVRPMPQVPEWEKIATRILEYMDRAIRTEGDLNEILAHLDEDVNQILAKRRWMVARGGVAR